MKQHNGINLIKTSALSHRAVGKMMKLLITLSTLAAASAAFDGTKMEIMQTGFLKMKDCGSENKMYMVVPINTCIHDSSGQRGGKAIKYTNVAKLTGYDDATGVGAADTVQYKIAIYYSSDCSDPTPMDMSSFMYAIRDNTLATNDDDCGGDFKIDTGREMADYLYDDSHHNYTATYGKTVYAVGGFGSGTYSTNRHYGEYMPSLSATEFDDMDQNGLVNKYYSSSDCGTLTGGMWYRNATCHAKLVPNRASNLTSSFKITDMASIQKFSDSSCSYEITDTTTYANTQPKNMDRVDYVIDYYGPSPPTPVGHTACTVVAQSKWVSGLPVMGSYYITSGKVAEATSPPTSMPTFTAESYGQTTWDVKKRHRVGGLCENGCSGHGSCVVNQNCLCYTGMDGEPEWTGPDCSLRTCPRDYAWVGDVVNANDLHPWAECSNRGTCDRKTGVCACFPGYDGVACQRFACPNNCNERGTCWPEKHLAVKASRVYDSPWDAMKAVGCLCDAGYRGPSCEFQECPSGADPLDGYGNEAGRDCSGRGLCDYGSGTCNCFSGFFGTRCQYQTTLM